MKLSRSFRFLILAGGSILFVSHSPDALGQTVNWKTSVDGAWNDPTKWNSTPPTVPLPSVSANFAGGTYTVTVDSNTINNLGVAATQVTFNLAGNLTVSDTLGLIPAAGGKIIGTGTLNSGKIALNGGTFTISQAHVSTGDFMSDDGGTLLIQNKGTLTSGANTITSNGFKATVDGTDSKWTNTGLLRAAALTITSGGTVTTDSARIDGTLSMTAGTLKAGELLFNIGGGTVKQGSNITSTTAMITALVTMDASTWDNSAGKLTKQNNLLKMTGGAQLSSKSAELSASGGVSVEGAGTVWNNTEDLTVTASSLSTGLLASGGGLINIGRDLLVAPTGFAGLNYTDNSVASRMEVAGKVDVSGGSIYEGKNGTITSKGVVTRGFLNSFGNTDAASLSVNGTWTNTGDFVVGESGQNTINNPNGLEVRGTLTTTADLIVGKLATANDFTLWDGSAVTDVNGVLAQGAGVVTNAFIGNFGATSAKWTNTGTLTIADAGTANLQIDTGGKVSSAVAMVGKQSGGKGTVDMRSGGNWTVNGDLTIGAAGKGSVAVDTGSTLKVTGTTLTLGRDTGSTGSLTLANSGQTSVFDFTGDLKVGLAGSGTLNIARGFQLDRATKALVLAGLANSSGTLDVMDDGSRYKSGDLTIGSLGVGVLKIENKGFTQTTGMAIVGEMAGGDGMATLTGAGSKWQVDGSLIVGKGGSASNNARGTVTVSANTTLTVNGARLVLGQETGSRGTLVVDGENAKVDGTGATNLEIGRHGTGTLQLQNHAKFTVASTILGVQNDGAGRITVAGVPDGASTHLEVNGSLTVGGASAGVAAGAFEPGSKGGELVISGGGTVSAFGTLIVARDAGSTGSVELSGKGSALNIIDAVVGQGGTGTFTISSGATFSAGSLTLGQNPGSDGTMRITGSGGTDDASLHATHLTVGKEGAGRLFLENGAKLDYKFLDVTVGERGNASGQVTVEGAGSLLNVGQIDLGAGGGNGQLKILSGGKVTVDLDVHAGQGEGLPGGGSILVGGAGSTFMTPSLLLRTASSGLPALSVTAGGSVVVTGADDHGLEAGKGSGGVPAVLINGAGARLTAANGKSSVRGSMTISGGGSASFNRLEIIPSSGDALVSVGGDAATTSTLNVSSRLTVGAQGREGTLDIGAGGEMTGDLIVEVVGGEIKVHDQGARLSSPFIDLTLGTLHVSNGGHVSVGNRMSVLGGQVSLFGDGARLNARALSLGGNSTLAATSGTGATIDTSLVIGEGSSVSNGGSINIGTSFGQGQAPDGTIQVGAFGRLQDNGEIFGRVVTLPGGKLSGSGTINGRLINGGITAPGDPQTLTVNGDYEQLAGGVLQIAIAGKAPAALDHLNVTGQTTLAAGAKLVLNFIEGFAPKTGDVFGFLQTPGGLIGGFTSIVIQGLAAGFQYAMGSDASGNFGLTALNDGVYVPGPVYDLVELPPVDSATGRTAKVTLQLPVNPPAATVYRVSASSDLLSWTTIATRTGAGPWSGNAVVTTGAPLGGFVRVTVAETLPLDGSNRFHRLETEETSP